MIVEIRFYPEQSRTDMIKGMDDAKEVLSEVLLGPGQSLNITLKNDEGRNIGVLYVR